MKINIVNTSINPLPEYSTKFSSGLDLRASLDEPYILKPMKTFLVPTGIYISIEEGYEAQVRPRSGLAAKYGISVLNTPGTIDADYRGEIKIILINFSDKDFVVNNGDRIAQLVFAKVEKIEWEQVESLNSTERKDGGFGHSGIN